MLNNEEQLKMLASLETLGNKFIGVLLKEVTKSKIEEVSNKIAQLSREELDRNAKKAHDEGRRISLWLFNREYTNRNIPPIFRNLQVTDLKVPICDFVWYDLEWLTRRYPGHQPELRKWSKIFELNDFSHSSAGMIYSELKGDMWRNVKALSLKNEWQLELNILKKYDYTKMWDRLQFNKDRVLMGLRAKHHARNPNMSKPETATIIQRRLDIWLCSALSSKKAQQTANLYKGLTGIDITRQMAFKITNQVLKDFPDAFLKKDLS